MVLVLGGLIQGIWTNRWDRSHSLLILSERMKSIPLSQGLWVADEIQINQKDLLRTGVNSSYVARYENQETGTATLVMVVAGLPSEIAAHTPEDCYPTAGYALGPIQNVTFMYEGRIATLKTADTVPPAESPELGRLRILWCWNDGSGWKAPENPRITYVHTAALCKVYLISSIDEIGDDNQISVLEENLGYSLLPQLERLLFGGITGNSDK